MLKTILAAGICCLALSGCGAESNPSPYVNIFEGVAPKDAEAAKLSRPPPTPWDNQIAEWQSPGPPFPPNSLCYVNGCWHYTDKVVASESTAGRSDVSLVKEGGTFKVPVLINGVIPLDFTVDSGAADVSIPADVVVTLMRTGTLHPDDFLGTQTYLLADGSSVPSKIFRIRSLKVGDKVIKNVTASMAKVEGSLLLGQSFLSRFKLVSFDYNRKVLELE